MTERKFFLAAALLTCVLVLQTVSVKAQFAGGDGSSGNPYQIATAAQLDSLARRVNAGDTAYNSKYYKLTNNINLSAYGSNFNNGKGWIPIGNFDNNDQNKIFRGEFDGDSKTITGLYINDANYIGIGLFGFVSYGTVKNIGIENANITGDDRVGGIAGTADNVINCYVAGSISGKNYVGGVVGIGNSINCYSTGTINGSGEYIGGVIGYINWASSSNCYSTCDVNGNDYVGGVAGYIGHGSITNSYSIGTVNGTGTYVGGVVGYLDCYQVKNCVALNSSVKTTGIDVGRVVGYKWSSGSTFLSNNAAWNGILNNTGNTTWNNKGLEQIDGADLTTTVINTDSSLGGRFTIANEWTTAKGKLPGLFGQTVDMPEHLRNTNQIPTLSQKNTLKIYMQNGTLYISGLTAGDVWNVYNMLGIRVYKGIASGNVETWYAASLPNGIYIVQSGNKTGKIMKQDD